MGWGVDQRAAGPAAVRLFWEPMHDRAVPIRDLAELMAHDAKTHQKHYGQWTTDEDTKESVLRAVGLLLKPTGNPAKINGGGD